MENNLNLSQKHNNKKPSIHFIGIGGIGMSALAGISLAYGFRVSGSDTHFNCNILHLQQKGAEVFLGHNKHNIGDNTIIVYTSAVKPDNPELAEAIRQNRCVMERNKYLGVLFNSFKESIAISGSHGKTTCTSMLGKVLVDCCSDPQLLIGGNTDYLNGLNYRYGEGCVLAEACEYKRNFLALKPLIGVILNIEADHTDYFKDVDQLIKAFKEFSLKIRPNGTLIYCGDDENSVSLKEVAVKRKIKFGLKDDNDCQAINLVSNKGLYDFDIKYEGKIYAAKLNINGKHHIYNALATFVSAMELGIEPVCIVESLANFKGVQRRFENLGKAGQMEIIKDYAHHPREIIATIDGAKEKYNKVAVVFQPHTYSRTRDLMEQFITCFNKADDLVLLPVYSAREAYDKTGSSFALHNNLKKNNVKSRIFKTSEEIASYLKNLDADVVLFLGAGDIEKVAEEVYQKLSATY